MCYAAQEQALECKNANTMDGQNQVQAHASILIGVPARDDKKAEVYQFPEEKLRYVVPRAQSKDTGECNKTVNLSVIFWVS